MYKNKSKTKTKNLCICIIYKNSRSWTHSFLNRSHQITPQNFKCWLLTRITVTRPISEACPARRLLAVLHCTALANNYKKYCDSWRNCSKAEPENTEIHSESKNCCGHAFAFFLFFKLIFSFCRHELLTVMCDFVSICLHFVFYQ